MDSTDKCNHKWVYMESIYRKHSEDVLRIYTRTDLFFCEKCLEQKQTTKSETQDYRENIPDWFKG